MTNLNDKQQLAVQTTEGPLLILAGAGSGKTTVLVNRIANIIESGLTRPWNILAITFTNKAANELKSRIERMLSTAADGIWASTFHTACLRFLRRDIDKIGYRSDFVIYDRSDQLTLIKEALREFKIDDKLLPPKAAINEIGRAKDRLKTVEAFQNEAGSDYRLKLIARVYSYYQSKLKANNALDFDDMIMLTVRLFQQEPEVLAYYQDKFHYILVDEYQDTNHAQYKLVSLLAARRCNICVVGDDDQSIYKFRGANIENILNFEDEYPDATVIKLEQNYRSTQTILDAANSVIKNNRGRKGKHLWTDNLGGEKIQLFTAQNEYDESQYVADRIAALHEETGIPYKNFAVLYRMNSQSRVIEEMLIKSAIPYRVLGGLRFYDRQEIKDISAYLRLIYNPSDDVSLRRVINTPRRGIGRTTVDKAADLASANATSIFEVAAKADQFPEFNRGTAKHLSEFVRLIESFRAQSDTPNVSDFINRVLIDSGYITALEVEKSIENQTRLENLSEFLSIAQSYQNEAESPNLGGFLEKIALYSDIDTYDEDDDSTVLMTLHTSKGLEFPVVFLVGMEEGLFPGYQNMMKEEEMEEERRLCYVGVTRAKERLFLTHANSRTIFANTTRNKQSRFISEIPIELIETERAAAPSRLNYGVSSVPGGLASQVRKTPTVAPIHKLTFTEGQQVTHRKFGKGFIISIQSVGADYRLEVAFEDVGTKNLMAAYANLTPLAE